MFWVLSYYSTSGFTSPLGGSLINVKGRVSVIGDLAQPAGLPAVAGVQLTHACLILPKNTEIKGRKDFLTQVVRLILLPKILPIINMAFCFNLQKKKIKL